MVRAAGRTPGHQSAARVQVWGVLPPDPPSLPLVGDTPVLQVVGGCGGVWSVHAGPELTRPGFRCGMFWAAVMGLGAEEEGSGRRSPRPWGGLMVSRKLPFPSFTRESGFGVHRRPRTPPETEGGLRSRPQRRAPGCWAVRGRPALGLSPECASCCCEPFANKELRTSPF